MSVSVLCDGETPLTFSVQGNEELVDHEATPKEQQYEARRHLSARGAKQQEAFEKIKYYLSSPQVLKAPRRGVPFKLYIAAEDKVIGAVSTQETEGKEYVVTYIGR